MPRVYRPTTYISRKLRQGGWLGLEVDTDQQTISCPVGNVLSKNDGKYTLTFQSFNGLRRQYNEARKNYQSITFPVSFKINDYIYFRGGTGNYLLSNEKIFKKIVNPKSKKVESIELADDETKEIRYDSSAYKLTIPASIFRSAMSAAEAVRLKTSSYSGSVENYLSNKEASNFTNESRTETTAFNRGEIKFSIDRLNLPTKRKQRDLLKYLDPNDISSIESLADKMLRFEVFSEDFMRKINDYFIKERLQDIIQTGREILELGTTDLSTVKAQKVIEKVGYKYTGKGSLEALWQEYFRKYLLLLIFSYKKIFPKIELNDIEGDKKYPDFVGINHYNGLDIIEIKTHLATLLFWDKSHKNFYFSAEVSKAITQTKNYMDSIIRERFKNTSDKTRITQSTEEENLYHPRAIIIISSFDKLSTYKEEPEKLRRDFTKLRNGLNDIEILTFDEILDIADEYIKNISQEEVLG